MVKADVSTHELVAGRYRLLEVLHRETNRICWYGEDIQVERPCLLTQVGLPPDPDEDSARRTTARVIRMSETLGLLCPGRVAPVVDAVVAADTLWTVTDCIDGIPLGELVGRHGTFSYVRAARIGLELLDVLEAAHGAGITHGELSPGQVFVQEGGTIVVTGFGLAGATLAPRVAVPSYASPEQARDQLVGPAADLWTLGAILYTMVEGRPPFRDRDRPESTLRGVDRLPLRAPLRAGPLTRTVQGLLRKNCQERLTRPVVREALTRVLDDDPETAVGPMVRPRTRGMYAVGPGWSRRTMVAGTALAVVTVTVAVLAVTRELPGTTASASDTPPTPSPSVSAVAPGGSADADPDAGPGGQSSPPPVTPTPTTPAARPSATPTGNGLPAGFRVFRSPEGFSVALPEDWKALSTTRMSNLAYRVILGAKDDPRTLAITYSERVGDDAVAVWRDDVEPDLKTADGFRRIGAIRATTYQGNEAADMEWLVDADGTRTRTFGRGFLIGEGRGYSLRWTTPAADWDDAANVKALDTFLKTFRQPSD